jgi:hypothetical protein
MSDGKGGPRLSLDVAREGVTARLESAGFVGRSAPALEQARASVMAIFVAFFGFFASAGVLAYYAKGWQRTPVLESLEKASRIFGNSKAYHVAQRAMTSHTFKQLQLAATRSHNISPQWKALYKFQTQVSTALKNSHAGRLFQDTLHHAHLASGAPVALDDISHIATVVAITFFGLALILVAAAAVRVLWRVNRRRLLAPLSLLCTSAVFFVLGAISYEAFQKVPLGQPGSNWTAVEWLLDGNFRFWPVVIFPLCAGASIVLAVIGGVKLIRRAEFAPRMYRLQGSLAVVAAGCLCIVVASTLSWVVALSAQAPDFLTAKDGGIFGTSFLTVFVVAIVVMIGTSWLVVTNSTRCLRSVRTL